MHASNARTYSNNKDTGNDSCSYNIQHIQLLLIQTPAQWTSLSGLCAASQGRSLRGSLLCCENVRQTAIIEKLSLLEKKWNETGEGKLYKELVIFWNHELHCEKSLYSSGDRDLIVLHYSGYFTELVELTDKLKLLTSTFHNNRNKKK